MSGSSKILLGFILGGMMSVDMGGPFNKAAYVFGTASIAAGNYDIMAAVMIGGMVPPCAIALATLLFKDKFTKEERQSGPVNFIMGLAFITEGAIPYAASDPLHVLPACIIGAARDRNDCINRTPWITEKESCLKRFRWIKENCFLRSKERKTSHWMDIT